MPEFARGTVTFLFTDIEGSTRLWERDREVMATVVERHLALLRATIANHDGVLFKIVGDAVQAAFPTAPDAVAAALDAQRALVTEAWSEVESPFRVRMALHTTAAEPHAGDYFAPGLNRLSRLLTAAHGGQVLVSLATQELARDALPVGASLGDLGEHLLRDLYRPERVFQLLHRDLPADFPPLRTLASRPNNLPMQPTPFVGREEQVARIVGLLRRNDVRLVTITGPGGVGKTRLALQAAAELFETFPDGVWFVDLSLLDDPTLVPSAIGDVLGIRDEGSALLNRLSHTLDRKHLLLVLDNFERVVDAASNVADLLAYAPGVKVLTTSRTPLHAYGEREFSLAPFPMPDPTQLSSVETLSQYDAVRLFVECAQAVKPEFAVTDTNAPAVAEICHRLDGLPLAIELAAAFVKMLPPQALLKRLDQRLPLLAGGARTLPARQQTMRNTIAWSHDFLTLDEQTLFRRLAIFAGGCTIGAAEAVAAGEEILDVFGLMASLVDKSLLRQDEGADDEPHFRMLETVREFGLERLEVSGEETSTRHRHAEFYLALLERHDLENADPTLLDLVEREHDNLRAALAWSWETGKHDTLLRLAAGLTWFWYYRGHVNEGLRWLRQALETPTDDGASRTRAWALTASGLLANVAGETDRASEVLTESFTWWERSGDAGGFASARGLLGGVRVNQGRYAEAETLFAANEVYFRDNEAALRDINGQAYLENWLGYTHFHLGLIAWVQGDEAHARTLLQDAVERFDRFGTPTDAIDSLRYLGLMACTAGDLDDAAMWFRKEVVRLRQQGSHAAIAVGLADVATLAAAREAWQAAARLFAKADALLKTESVAFSLPAREYYERAHRRATEALGDSAQAVAAAGRAVTLEQALAEAAAVLEMDHYMSADAAS